MRVKELIRLLVLCNPEDLVGRLSTGQDTGDLYTFESDEIKVFSEKALNEFKD